jgi:hypothetical protein
MTKELADSWQRQEIFLFSIVFRPALAPTQPPSYIVGTGSCLLGVEQLGHEADYSPPSKAMVKNSGAVPRLFHMSSRHTA